MRVHERGVGETRSCGTGTVAAVVAALRAAGETTGDVAVRTPGGRLRVTVTDGHDGAHGPAVLVASGELDADWWAGEPVHDRRTGRLDLRPESARRRERSGGSMPPTMTELSQYGSGSDGPPSVSAASSTSRSAARCAAWPACPPSSPTSPRSSTGSCASSASCSSASGPRAAPSRPSASLTELARLAETAGSQVLDGLIQRRSRPDPATFIGSGKVAELGDAVRAAGADTVICDGELSPGQLRQLEDKLKVKVIDRTALILDIFAQHARSRDGKAQVELAQLSYLLPRLRGWGEALSRQVGGRAAGGVGHRRPRPR